MNATTAVGWIASIPSPSFNTIDIGPRPLTLYGLMIGLGIIAAAMLGRHRAPARRLHPDVPLDLLMWVIPAGVVGARLYHVLTDGVPFSDWHKIWNGGLGIPGGIILGAFALLAYCRARDLNSASVLDTVVPGVALAQAIGRWGNWWNQELYGGPTDLPWGLEIDAAHRISGYVDVETFHPTFLYESLWNLALCGFLLWIDRRKVLKPGKLMWVYAGGYAIGRLWIEMLRVDPATEIAGIRINLWTMTAVLIASAFFLRNGFRRGDDSAVSAVAASVHDDDTAEDAAEDAADANNGASGEEE